MKILFLNTWGGRAGREKLLNFIESHKNDVDIFCFQEVWAAPYEHHEGSDAGGRKISHKDIMTHARRDYTETLPEHVPFFHPSYLENYGLMMLVHQKHEILESGDVFVYKEKGYIPEGDIGNHARNIQYVTTSWNDTKLTTINFHGIWNGKGKTDCAERIEQSQKIIEFVQGLEGEVVLGGDFNLLPHTESIAQLENAGLENLIRTHNIQTTRTSLYDKFHNGDNFADYVFVSEGIKVKDFVVMPDEVSDHAPLLVEI